MAPAAVVVGGVVAVALLDAVLPSAGRLGPFDPPAALGAAAELSATLKVTGQPAHVVRTRTGGAEWLMSGYTITETAKVLGGNAHGVAFKGGADDFGLRWDTRTHQSNNNTHDWFNRVPGKPWSFPETLDEELTAAEAAGWVTFYCQPLPRRFVSAPAKGEGYPWQTDQYYANMAQYILGTANSDYRERVARLPTLDSVDSRNRGFNWANLRAARGRVAPYRLDGFCMGQEPYWLEDLSSDEYMARYKSRVAAIRSLVPNAKFGLFMMNGGDHIWEGEIVGPGKITSDMVDFLILRDNYHGFGNPRKENMGWFLGAYNAWDVNTSGKQFNSDGTRHFHSDYEVPATSLNHPEHAKQYVDRWFPNKPELKQRLIWTEWGYTLTSNPGTNDDLGMAIMRAGQFAESIRQDVWMSATWTMNNDPKYNFGLVARVAQTMELTPSYHAAKMLASLLGTRFVPSQVSSPTYDVDPPTGFPLMRIRYLDAWLFADGDARVLFVINRHRTEPVRLNLEGLTGYRPTAWKQLGGQGFNDLSDNHSVANHVVARDRPVGPLVIEPLSVNLIRLAR